MPDHKYAKLRNLFREMESVVVTFSGGIDSTLLAKVAFDELGDRALALTGVSPSLASSELEEAREIARSIGIPHAEVVTQEMENPEYASNPGNRCYYCKSELFSVASREALRRGYRCVVEGTHTEDLNGHRPGFQAAREQNVRSPFVEAGFTKADIRELARELGLSNWDKPALACLASRIPTGTSITLDRLGAVEAAERVLRAAGARQVRARYHGETVRIELPPEEMPLIGVSSFREKVRKGCIAVGFCRVVVDVRPYGSRKSLNSCSNAATIDEIRNEISKVGLRTVQISRDNSLLSIRAAQADLDLLRDPDLLDQVRQIAGRLEVDHITVDLFPCDQEYVPLQLLSSVAEVHPR